MAIPLPRPASVIESALSTVDQARDAVATVVALPTRLLAVVDGVETLLARITGIVGRIEETLDRTDRVLGDAETAAGQVAGTVQAAQAAVATATSLLAAFEPALRRAAPMAARFVDQLSHEEVTAAIRLVDELPKLKEHLTADILPILATLDRVGPDLHDLLDVTRDLKLAVAGIPGLGMLRRRGVRLGDDPLT